MAYGQCLRLRNELSKTRKILSSYVSDEDKPKLTKTGTEDKKKQLVVAVLAVIILFAMYFSNMRLHDSIPK